MKPMLLEPPLTRQEEGGAVDDRSQAMRAASGLQSHLELSLGISSDTIFNVATGRVGEKRHRGGSSELPPAFPAPKGDLALHRRDEVSLVEEAMKSWSAAAIHSGFVHPWSLAARQQKAVLEQAHRSPSLTRLILLQVLIGSSPSTCQLTSITFLSSHPRSDVCYDELHMISRFTVWITVSAGRAEHPVGWPPVRASRKNIASANLVRVAMDGEKDAKRPKLGEGEAAESDIRSRPTMFVKVNMEGYVFGRKIDLKAHDGYQSLSRALCKLFRNFLSCT
ncbi:hypothetical protein B296_00006610 [Ensete ventricosum]|uniref:Auxin-responsive protein n=1 Tax=Ensete ventricosum TaxID=4639 RepID=A0A426ZXP1_ENSVE|nr:hypothetical protein B296_00006610 [Ensete ventricosum]